MTKDLNRAAEAIETFLVAVGAPVGTDPELRDTGRRVAEAFTHDLLAGYAEDPRQILADTTATQAPGLVAVTGIQASTTCPHHLMPASGLVHVGYLPSGKVVGLGALVRLVHCYARRLSLQEDLGRNVAEAIVRELGARGAACVVSFHPTCVTSRGEREHGAEAVTHAWAGAFEKDAALRSEFLTTLPTPSGG